MRNIGMCKLYDPVFIYFVGFYSVFLHPWYQQLYLILLTVKYTGSSYSSDVYMFLCKYKDKGFMWTERFDGSCVCKSAVC